MTMMTVEELWSLDDAIAYHVARAAYHSGVFPPDEAEYHAIRVAYHNAEIANKQQHKTNILPELSPADLARYQAGKHGTPPPPATVKAPRGIFYLLDSDQPISSKQSCWTNPGVVGVRLRMGATAIVKGPNDYDFSQLSVASALASANGKQWTIGIQWGPTTPAFVGAKTYALSNGTGPAPWDPLVIAAQLEFLQAFGKAFDGDPNLAGVILGGVGTNSGFESYVAKSDADIALLAPVGGVPEWIDGVAQVAAGYASAFPTTAIIMACGVPFPKQDAALQSAVDAAMAKYPNFGAMCCSLSTRSVTAYTPNGIVNQYAATHPCGFQFVSSTADQTRTGGTVAEVCANGESLLGEKGFIEVYAHDADDPANTATLTAISQRLGAF